MRDCGHKDCREKQATVTAAAADLKVFEAELAKKYGKSMPRDLILARAAAYCTIDEKFDEAAALVETIVAGRLALGLPVPGVTLQQGARAYDC